MVRMKKSFFIYAALPLLILSACGNNARNGGRHHVPCVKAVVVDSSSMSVVSREFIGTADGSYSAVLSFPLSGTVEKIYVREGERVEAGELVAELDSRVAESSLMAARAAFDAMSEGLTIIDTEGRIAYFICQHCEYNKGKKILKIKMDDLARIINETRLAVSKTLNKMQEDGWIELHRGEIVVPQLELLTENCL